MSGSPPTDGHLAASYGPVAATFQGWMEGFGQFLSQPIPELEPSLFADAVLALVETPAGQRPARKVVGLSFQVDPYNEAAGPYENGLLNGQQLGFLMGDRSAS